MNIPAKIYTVGQNILVELPLTNPTGKIRVKRRYVDLNYGLPIATKQVRFTPDDYVEWQISYATSQPGEETAVKDIVIDDHRVGFELTKVLCEGLKTGLILSYDIQELKNFAMGIGSDETLEENEKIFREEGFKEIKGGFKKFIEAVPLFIKTNQPKGYFIEIALRHKQRAIGLQAMVYLCLYIYNLKDRGGKPLIGRTARAKECGVFTISAENKEIVFDVVKAFSIASLEHNRDILKILERVQEKYGNKPL